MRILNLEFDRYKIGVHDFHANRYIIKVIKEPEVSTGERLYWHFEPPKIKTLGLLKTILNSLYTVKNDPDIGRLIKLLKDFMK